MKIKVIILSTVLAIGVVSGCASEESKTPATTTIATTTTTIPRTTTTVSKVDVFVSAVKTRLPGASRDEIIELGQQACTTIEAYGSVELAIYGIASDPSWSMEMAKMASFIMGAGIPVFCPEYTAELQRLTR